MDIIDEQLEILAEIVRSGQNEVHLEKFSKKIFQKLENKHKFDTEKSGKYHTIMKGNDPVGVVSLTNWRDRTGEMSFLIDSKYSKGLIIPCITRELKRKYNLKALYTEIHRGDESIIRYLLKSGFVHMNKTTEKVLTKAKILSPRKTRYVKIFS